MWGIPDIQNNHVLLLHKEYPSTVKRLIIGDYLFGEIGEFFKFAKISCHQIETLQSLDITSVGNRQINSLPNCHIWKTANIIAAKYSRFTVNTFTNRTRCHVGTYTACNKLEKCGTPVGLAISAL